MVALEQLIIPLIPFIFFVIFLHKWRSGAASTPEKSATISKKASNNRKSSPTRHISSPPLQSLSNRYEYWRQVRSICVLQLLSNKRVQSYRPVREEETSAMVEKIRQLGFSSSVVNLSDVLVSLTNDIICRVALGRKYNDYGEDKKFKNLLLESGELLGATSLGDYIPWLGWIDRVNGLDARDMFAAGTDTTCSALEWAIAELIKNPRVMKILQNEVREVDKRKEEIGEDDVEKMPYLKAVIKESLRLHSPVPLLIPRESTQDTKIMGYDISAGTRVVINAWAIARDPSLWENPEDFIPERFLGSSIDFRGLHFELVPFGSGRRGCPGIAFAMAVDELALAKLVHTFNFALPNGGREEDLNMSETTGITVHKKFPLLVAVTSHIC
ncbi:hypothetical protein DH2020_019188 [Rehmannia glutinosa]|uniref:Uncharacterized protein n=1 Tax=Rehmannia glutinosa TaxID=99300 RepID=A0ABR0WNS3_REHGL